jgi:uncharacterized protein with HEPN domain
VTRSDEERFADILNAIDRFQSYEQYLRSDELGSMAYDAVLRNLGVNPISSSTSSTTSSAH